MEIKTTLKHIENGETMESVRNKINELIDNYNLYFPVTKSYLDLEDKPAIDGNELMPLTTMKEFSIPVESLPNSLDLVQLFIDSAKTQAEIVARNVAKEEIENSNQLSNIPETMGFAEDNWMVLVYIKQNNNTMKLYKTTLEEITKKAVWASNKFENQLVEPPLDA